MTPRNINGVVVYETVEEHERQSLIEYGSTGTFVLGIFLGLVYMRQWGVEHLICDEDEDYAEDAS